MSDTGSAIVTTSYAPDFERFVRLHASVREYSDLPHYVFVPEADRRRFTSIPDSRRLTVVSTRDVLPRNFVTTEWLNRAVARIPSAPGPLRVAAVNRRRPWPPVRGWILQQLVKMAAAERVEAETLVFVDSETEFVRPITSTTFRHGSVSRLFRRPDGIEPDMARHRTWHEVGRRLIGALPDGPAPYDDFIGGITSWDAALARACTAKIAEVSGAQWQTTVAAQLDISEYILYGEYVSQFATAEQLSFTSDRSLLHIYWEDAPLDRAGARRFIDGMRADDVAVHIQSNTRTSREVEDYIRSALKRQTI